MMARPFIASVLVLAHATTSEAAFVRPPTVPLARAQKTTTAPLLYRLRGGDHVDMSALAAQVCPALGVVLSNALYAAPLGAVRDCVKAGELGQFNPIPSSLMVIATTCWLSYGFSVGNPWIVASNVPGAMAALYAFVNMTPLMKPGPELKQVQTTILGGAACTLSLWTALIFSGVSGAVRSYWLGLYATAVCILLFASPLSTIASVISSKDSGSILAPLTIAQVTNCLMWTVYGLLAAKDIFVWGPNGTGLILGLIQLALKLCFPSK